MAIHVTALPRPLQSVLVLICFAGSLYARAIASSSDASQTEVTTQTDFSPTKLRGYGIVSGKYSANANGGSMLRIECQDVDHAKLLQAKYLSDLGELPPVPKTQEINLSGAKVSIQVVEGASAVAALRNGAAVLLVAAKDADSLGKLIVAEGKGNAAKWASTAEVKVPMYLDRFDKYGFRFYYAPGSLKPLPNGQPDPAYDPHEDFNFAKANGGSLLAWTGALWGETAEGLTRRPSWNWALEQAEQTGIAFGLNTGIEGSSNWYFNRYPNSLMQFDPDFLGTYYGSMNFGIPPMVSWTNAPAKTPFCRSCSPRFAILKTPTMSPVGSSRTRNWAAASPT